MQNDSSGIDPKTIWQNQPTETPTMTLLLIRKKARELHAKTRGELLRSIFGPVLVAGLGGFGLGLPDPVLRAVFVFAIAWSLAGLYFLNRGMWSAAIPGDAALSPSLESYRREVERRRYLFSRVMRWGLGPVLLVIATWILAAVKMRFVNRTTLPKVAPFLILMTIWLVSMFFVRRGQQRELQREIDDLNEIERANKS
jgi:hypothetical protein